MAILTCRGAAFAYEGNLVLTDLNFTVDSGDYLCIVGENGSGKSTLMKGLLKLKAPVRGEILLEGGLASNQIGYLPQQTPVQKDFPASVYEVALSGRQGSRGALPFYSREDKRIVMETLALLGLENPKKTCYRELSGGQQQRVLLARALCATRRMLLLDEPVTGLDPVMTADLYRLIHRLNQEQGITILMVSHDVRSAVEYASHILHLGSRQLFFGSCEEYKKSPVGKRFLGGEEDA